MTVAAGHDLRTIEILGNADGTDPDPAVAECHAAMFRGRN
jgi:hypothetical protein